MLRVNGLLKKLLPFINYHRNLATATLREPEAPKLVSDIPGPKTQQLLNDLNMIQMASYSQQVRSSKRNRDGTSKSTNDDNQIVQWLEELEEQDEFGDVDDEVADKDYVIEEEIHEASEISEAEEEEDIVNYLPDDPTEERCLTPQVPTRASVQVAIRDPESTRSGNYHGKGGFVWSKTELARTSRTPAHNFVSLPRTGNSTSFPGYKELWSKFIDDEMMTTIVESTNKRRSVSSALPSSARIANFGADF